jgi:hypothetical protein
VIHYAVDSSLELDKNSIMANHAIVNTLRQIDSWIVIGSVGSS